MEGRVNDGWVVDFTETLDDAGDDSLVDELPVALLGDELEQRSHQAVLDL